MQERYRGPRAGPEEGYKDDQGTRASLWWGKDENCGCSASRREDWEGTSSMSMSICREGPEDGPGTARWCWAMGQEATGRNRGTGSSTWTSGRSSLMCRWQSTGTGYPDGLWISSHSLGIFKNHLDTLLCHVPWDETTWAGRLDQMPHCGSFQLDPSYDSVKEAHYRITFDTETLGLP